MLESEVSVGDGSILELQLTIISFLAVTISPLCSSAFPPVIGAVGLVFGRNGLLETESVRWRISRSSVPPCWLTSPLQHLPSVRELLVIGIELSSLCALHIDNPFAFSRMTATCFSASCLSAGYQPCRNLKSTSAAAQFGISGLCLL